MRSILILFCVLSMTSFAQTDNERGTIVVHSNCEKYLGSDTLFSKVDKMPLFPGGEKAQGTFLRKRFVFPKQELENGIRDSSIVSLVQFTVQKNGALTDVRIFETSKSILFDEEAIRVVKLMPKWIVGECDGEKVSVVCYVRVYFTFR